MKTVSDKETGVAYISLVEERSVADAEVRYTLQIDDDLIADFNDRDELVGLEVLNLSRLREGEPALVALARRKGPELRRQVSGDGRRLGGPGAGPISESEFGSGSLRAQPSRARP